MDFILRDCKFYMDGNTAKIESESPKIFSADWWHLLIFHKTFNRIKKFIWLNIHVLPAFFVERWQMQEIRPLLRQSYLYTPLYRKLLDEMNIRPENIRSHADLQKLPVMSKKLFRQYLMEELVNDSFPRWSYKWTETSGSTGEPFKFPINRGLYFFKRYYCGIPACVLYKIRSKEKKIKEADVYTDRFLLWRGLSWKTISQTFKFADIRVVNRPRGKYFLHIPVSDIRERPDSVIEKLLEFRPDVLSGRATTMIEISRIFQKAEKPGGLHIPFITSVGEMLTESQRKYLEKFFGSEVYERYGLEELGDVAIECQFHNGMHIHEESHIVEILDENNQSLPLGNVGRVVVTNLCNSSVPFIRYDTGDQGEILAGNCRCGITARRLKIHGRVGAYLELEGRRYQFPEFALIINDFSDFVLRSQIVKVAEEKIEFRFIPLRPVSEEEINKIESSFIQNLGITPLVRIVDEIPFNRSGKTQFLVDETK